MIIESNFVNFYENKLPFKLRSSEDIVSSHVPVIGSTKNNKHDETEPQRSKRVRVVKNYRADYTAYTIEEDPTNLQ